MRLSGSFPPLVASLHRLAAHFSGLFVAVYVLARLLPYLQLQTIESGENSLSWTFTTSRDAALPSHLFLVLPFIIIIIISINSKQPPSSRSSHALSGRSHCARCRSSRSFRAS
jgi:hypothetical protein